MKVRSPLYKNNGDLTFTLVSENYPVSSFFAGRAGTWADFNNDGYPELIVANNQEDIGIQIFENNNRENNWIAFELKGTSVSPDAFGTRISVATDLGVKIDEKTGGSSYASQSSHRIHFGLGQGQARDITVTWPDGSVDFFAQLSINEIHTITQGMSLSDEDGDSYTSDIDCDDTNPNVNPGALETPYNGIDDDCDPLTLDDDIDADGFLLAEDCNDNNPLVNPSAIEIVNNGIDDNCDGVVDETSAIANTLLPSSLKLYPNPAQDYLYIDSDNQIKAIEILNLQGQVVQVCSHNCHYLNLKDLAPAIYMVKVHIGTDKYITRIVKI